MRLDLKEISKEFGNGDEAEGIRVLSYLTMHIRHARCKHPRWAEGKYHALGKIHSEYKEFEHAVEHETQVRCKAEAGDLVATLVRWLNGEHEKIPLKKVKRQK